MRSQPPLRKKSKNQRQLLYMRFQFYHLSAFQGNNHLPLYFGGDDWSSNTITDIEIIPPI